MPNGVEEIIKFLNNCKEKTEDKGIINKAKGMGCLLYF